MAEIIPIIATKKPQKKFKILCIDGGGIKGLYAATILKKFEEWNKCSISDHFDMICGTSTGGIIALGISQKIPMCEICNFYKHHGPIIFDEKKRRLGKHRTVIRDLCHQIIGRGKFSDKNLKSALTDVFRDTKIKDSNNLLCIPSYSYTHAKNRVFKFDHKEGSLDRDNDLSYVDVALATAAAPTYFPLAEISNEQYIDGGVWANNPTLVGLIEALSYFVGKDKEYNCIQILSIGSIYREKGHKLKQSRYRSFIKWGGELFDVFGDGSSDFAHYFMSQMKDINDVQISYQRVCSNRVSGEQYEYVELDNASLEALSFFEQKGLETANEYKRNDEIQEMFKTKKTYITKE